MTVVAAVKAMGRVHMACDSQATNNGTIMYPAESKIVTRGRYLLGGEGTIAMQSWFRTAPQALFKPHRAGLVDWVDRIFGPATLEHFTKIGQLTDRRELPGQAIIACGSEFVVMDAAGHPVSPGPWWAIGSGGPEARGALFVCSAYGRNPADWPETASRAATHLDDGCGGQILRFTTGGR